MSANRRRPNPLGLQPAIGLWGILAICMVAVFTPGGPVQGTHGVLFALAGVLMLALPPTIQLPKTLYLLALALIVFAAFALLPAGFAGTPEWRVELADLGLELGGQISAHPSDTGEKLLHLGFAVVLGLYTLSHRTSPRLREWLALGFSVGVAVYALVSMDVQTKGRDWGWDPVPTFGLFPNRNHTATLLVMGAVCGVGSAVQSLIARTWGRMAFGALAAGTCMLTLVVYVGSRAGVLLLAAGYGLWIVGMVLRYPPANFVKWSVALAGVALCVFVSMDLEIEERFARMFPGQQVEAPATPDPDNGAGTKEKTVLTNPGIGFRLLIYQETLAMSAKGPWTGVGLGMFHYVFPQYRDLTTREPRLCLHPESDWLMVLSEAGILTALTLAILVGMIFAGAIRGILASRSWSTSLACLIAAAMVPLHGCFDVPGHRIGLALSALLLVTLTQSNSQASAALGPLGRSLFRAAGLCAVLFGVFLIRAEWFGGTPIGGGPGNAAIERIVSLYEEDQAAQAAGAPPIEDGSEDKIEQALAIADAASRRRPLDPELHYWRGSLALFFDDKDAVALQSFAAQRMLDPDWPMLAVRQAQAWLPIDPNRSAELWVDAVERSLQLFPNKRVRVYSAISRQLVNQEALYTRALRLATLNSAWAPFWARTVPREVVDRDIPALLELDETKLEVRRALLRAWHDHGDRAAALAYANGHPALGAQGVDW